jgi:pterin-4a-carbinolamine dehydratase
MTEKLYQCVAGTFRPSPKLILQSGDLRRVASAAANAVLDGARLDAELGLLRHFEAMHEGKERSDKYPGTISRSVRLMTHEEAVEFASKLEDLVTEWGHSPNDRNLEGAEDYTLSIVFFPLANQVRETKK